MWLILLLHSTKIKNVVLLYRKFMMRKQLFVLTGSFFLSLLLGNVYLLATSHAVESVSLEPLVENHKVLVKNITDTPLWMTIWDQAREAAKHENDLEALDLYRELFSLKPQVEEALREYAIILMNLKHWQEASRVTQKLLEIDPVSLEYQMFSGRIALVQKRYQSSTQFFGQVYNSSPDGPYSIEALKGQIIGLRRMGRHDMAYPLMEQLYLIIPHEEQLIRKLARLSKKLGFDEKALTYYTLLLTEFEPTPRDLLESEPLFVDAGSTEFSLKCWTEYLATYPYYIPFHDKISKYYLDNELQQKALPHLLIRIAHGEANSEIFLQTGNLYLYEEGRPDKALYYYEEFRKRNPDNKQVGLEIQKIQTVLANDLLIIVENEGAWSLWRDLAKVIPDRLAIYYSIAEQLEELGRKKELLEVLQIIQIHNPDDQKTLFKLARLYFELGYNSASLDTLELLLPEEQTGKEYLFLLAEISKENGNIQAH